MYTDSAAALKSLREAFQKAKNLQNPYFQAEASYHIGELFFYYQLYNRSFANFLNASKLYVPNTATKEYAFALLGVAKTQYHRGNYRYSSNNFIRVIKLVKEWNLPQLESDANEYLGLIYNAFQNFEQSATFFRKALHLKNKLDDEKGCVRLAEKLSEIYYESRRFDSAYYYADYSLQLGQKMQLQTDIYLSRLNKTASLIRLRKWEKVESELDYLNQNSPHAHDVNFRIRYQLVPGNYFLARNNLVKSKFHYDSARSILQHSTFPELSLLIFKNMAESYYDLGQYKRAYEYYQLNNGQLAELYTGQDALQLGNMEEIFNQNVNEDEIRYLSNENNLKELKLLRELETRQTLQRENIPQDSILQKEKLLSEALSRENMYNDLRLKDEQKLRILLSR